MALEDMEKKFRISDIARELQLSPQEVLLFVKKEGGKVASTSSMVNEEMHNQIFGHFSVEKKMVDETKKIREEKEKRLSRLEEQSRKTYEKEKHLSETLSPAPAPVAAAVGLKKEPAHDIPALHPALDAVKDPEVSLSEEPEVPSQAELPVAEPEKEEPSVNEHLVSFDAPQMMGGLTVLGTLDMYAGRNKKNRKKNFKEQADALKDEFEPKAAEEVVHGEEKVELKG